MTALYVAAGVLAVAAIVAVVVAWIYGDSAWRAER
jgi:hypothetical protein